MSHYADVKEQLQKSKRTFRELFLLSFIALFLELAIIRWLSSEIRIFAYFKNLPLMATFLDFGRGFAWIMLTEETLCVVGEV